MVLCTLQLSLFSSSCYSKQNSPVSKRSMNFAEILAKQQTHDFADASTPYRRKDDDQYAVILSDETDNEYKQQFEPQYKPQYAPSQHAGAAGSYQQQPQQLNPLLKQASTASIGILFILLIWRSLAAYELADQFNSGSFRILAVTPTVLILCANLMGFVINVMKPFNFKNFLKFILALNITREFVELLFNIVMLVANSPSSGISRDVYFGRFFMNVWWLSLCVTFSKSRWVVVPTGVANNAAPNSQQQQQPPPRNYQTTQDNRYKSY